MSVSSDVFELIYEQSEFSQGMMVSVESGPDGEACNFVMAYIGVALT